MAKIYTNSMLILQDILLYNGYEITNFQDAWLCAYRHGHYRIRADYSRGVIELGLDKQFDRWANSIQFTIKVGDNQWFSVAKMSRLFETKVKGFRK